MSPAHHSPLPLIQFIGNQVRGAGECSFLHGQNLPFFFTFYDIFLLQSRLFDIAELRGLTATLFGIGSVLETATKPFHRDVRLVYNVTLLALDFFLLVFFRARVLVHLLEETWS